VSTKSVYSDSLLDLQLAKLAKNETGVEESVDDGINICNFVSLVRVNRCVP